MKKSDYSFQSSRLYRDTSKRKDDYLMKTKFTVSPKAVAAATEAQLNAEMAIYKAVNDLHDIVADAQHITDVNELAPVLSDIEYAVTVLRSKLANYTEFNA